jgi:hypothetical protein
MLASVGFTATKVVSPRGRGEAGVWVVAER